MVGGGLQRACASTFRRLMPTSQGSQGSQEAEGSVVRGRGLGRGKGGPKGRGRGRPWRCVEEEEEQYEPEENEEEDDTVASAESSGGGGTMRRRGRTRLRTTLHRLSGCGIPRDSQTDRFLLPYGH